MEILFTKKFTSRNLDEIVRLYWDEAKNCESKIIFDLQEIEWIAVEELTFLFSWFRYLSNSDKEIYVKLPNIFSPNERQQKRLISLYVRWNIDSFVPFDFEKGYFLTDKYLNIDSSLDNIIKQKSKELKYNDNYWHKVIPFTEFNANYDLTLKNLREVFNAELKEVFNLEKKIEELLNFETTFSPFQNKSLSHIITTELFLNVVHHAYPEPSIDKKCYLSIVLNNKINEEDYARRQKLTLYEAKRVIEDLKTRSYLEERVLEECDFFRDKSTKKFKNESFVEFTFLDFGEGIPSTLRERFLQDINKKEIIEQLSNHVNSNKVNNDSKILEYAFLLNSSRSPFDQNIKIQNYVPRGLYFLADIVRRYKGMMIVRSNFGKIIFDFSVLEKSIKDNVKYLKNDKYLPFFQGTMISIILPSSSDTKLISAVQKRPLLLEGYNSSKSEYQYISILSIENGISNELKNNFSFIEIYHLLFKKLNEKLENTSNKKSILLIDFAGCSNKIIDHKIYFYLCNTPLINEDCTAIILNPIDRVHLENVQKAIIQSEIFIFRPIPCIINTDTNEDVFWIGLKNEEDGPVLTNLWKYLDYQESIPKSDLKDVNALMGNMIKVKDKYGNVTLTIASCSEVLKYYKNEVIPRRFIEEQLLNNNVRIQGESFKNETTPVVYWTSSGYYQKEFISFIELLYERSFSDQIATYLLNKFEHLPDVTKVIAVTLSSQLLASSICESFKDKGKDVELIRLKNYYDFSNEEPFRKIKEDEKVLVVNDVISTGYLNKQIYESINYERKANVVGICCILDTREKNNIPEVNHYFDEEIEKIIVCLASYEVKKFKEKPIPNAEIIAINPVINAPNTLRISKSNTKNIVYLDTNEEIRKKNNRTIKDFLKKLKPEYLIIGHIHNNTSHHPYFPETHKLFKDELDPNGQNLLKVIFHSVSEISLQNSTKGKNKQLTLPLEDKNNLVDFVFYPMFSGAEGISSPKRLAELLGVSPGSFQIFPLPRIETPKGWRFTFPPKILNEKIRDKSKVMIIDDGSVTGETLLQMIDSISFLPVTQITVVSIIGRLEDFQRELFSRLKSISVEYPDGKQKEVPISVFWGTHLHLKAFPSFSSLCPYCSEIALLNRQKNEKKVPQLALEFIEIRLKEIQLYQANGQVFDYENRSNIEEIYNPEIYNSDFQALSIPSYLPESIDKQTVYLIRDRIGKLETYRLFREYLQGFEVDKIADNEIDAYLAVILHEPNIYVIFKQFLPEIRTCLLEIVENTLFQNNETAMLLNWPKASIIRLYSIFMPHSFFNWDTLHKILIFCDNCSDNLSYQFISYFIRFYEDKVIVREEKKLLYASFWNNFKFSKLSENSKNVIRNFNMLYSVEVGETVTKAIEQIILFFTKSDSNPKHTEIELDIADLRSSVFLKNPDFDIEEFEIKLNGVIDKIDISLSQNLKTIFDTSRVEHLSETMKVLTSKHINGSESIFSVINQIKANKNQLINSIESINANKLKELIGTHLEELYDIISTRGSLWKDMSSFYTDIISCWNSVFEANKKDYLEPYNIIISLNCKIQKDTKVLIQEDVLKSIFRELIINISKETKNQNNNLKVNARLTTYKGKCIFTLNHFFNGEINGKISPNRIKILAEHFDGDFETVNENNHLIFKLTLLIQPLITKWKHST